MSPLSWTLCLLLLSGIVLSSALTPNQPLPRRTVDMPPGTKMIGYYWIDEDLYVIARPMTNGDHPQDWEATNVSIMSIDVPTVYIHETPAASAQRPPHQPWGTDRD